MTNPIGHSVRLRRRALHHKARAVGILAAFRRPGILLLLPVLLALAARVFVSPGWMIGADGGGSITVRVCSDPANPGELGRASLRERVCQYVYLAVVDV